MCSVAVVLLLRVRPQQRSRKRHARGVDAVATEANLLPDAIDMLFKRYREIVGNGCSVVLAAAGRQTASAQSIRGIGRMNSNIMPFRNKHV